MKKREEKESVLSSITYDQAFLMACENNNFEAALCMRSIITDIDVSDPINNYTGFIHAVNAKNYDAVKIFIDKGAYVNKIAGIAPWKFTALKFLASEQFDDNIGKIFQLIMDNGGDIMQVSSGENALATIYSCDNYNLMDLLLKANAGDQIFHGLCFEELISFLHESGKKGILEAFADNIITVNKYITNNLNPLNTTESSLLISDEIETEVLGGGEVKESS